jgi:multicomponent Na+:H+ antiporter subunit C
MIYNLNYIIAIFIFAAGLYITIVSNNLIKKLLGLAIFQTSVLLFYISMAKVTGGNIPVLKCLDYNLCPGLYTNPLPHVLMLTAIVVGVATLAVGLAIIIRIKQDFNTIDEEEIMRIEEVSE